MQKEYSNEWKHYKQVGDIETVHISDPNDSYFDARIWEETVSTSKQRVHAGYRTVLESANHAFCSEPHSTRIDALRDLAQQMKAHGYRLHVWGLDSRCYATDLSEGSGHGYIKTRDSGHVRSVRLISPAEPVSSSLGRTNGEPLQIPMESGRVSVVLLGDSIFDNQAYVEQDQAVINHLNKRLGTAGSARLLAVDGAVTRDVTRQLVRVPRDATHVFLSAGGNDALGCMSVLDQPVSTVMEALGLLAERQTQFAHDYLALADQLARLRLPVSVCTVYEDVPDLAVQLKTALSLFNDVIVRVALRYRFGILDLREHLQSATDYSPESPIEPSATGGDKIARAVARAAGVAA